MFEVNSLINSESIEVLYIVSNKASQMKVQYGSKSKAFDLSKLRQIRDINFKVQEVALVKFRCDGGAYKS